MIEKKQIDKKFNAKSCFSRVIALAIALVLVVSTLFYDMPSASANPDTSGVDPYEYLKSFLHTIDNSYSRHYEDAFDTMYNDYDCKYLLISVGDSLTEFLMFNYEPVSIDSPYSYLSFFRFDIDEITNSGVQAIAVCGQIWNASGEGYMVRANADTFYMNGFNKTTRSLLAGTQSAMTPYNSSSTNTGFNNFFGRQLLDYNSADYKFYHNYDLYIESLNTTYPATYSDPVDLGLISLSSASRDYPIGAVGQSVTLPVLRITPSSVEDDFYDTWDLTIHAVSDFGAITYSVTFDTPGYTDSAYFYDSSMNAALMPIYIDVPFTRLISGSHSLDTVSFLYVDSVHLVGNGDVYSYNAYYLNPFSLIGTLPDDVTNSIFDNRYDNYTTPYSTVTELEKGEYLVEFTNGGIDMTDWENISSQYNGDIFSYALQDADLSSIPSWADLYFVQAATGISLDYNSIISNIVNIFTSQYGAINLSVVSGMNKEDALAEVMSTGIADISDVIFVVYGDSSMGLYNWSGYFTHRFYTRKLDYDVIDAVNGISPQLGGILAASENQYRLFDSYYQYLDAYLDNFDNNLFLKMDSSNSRLNTIISSFSTMNNTVNDVDDKLSDVLTAFAALNSVNTGIGQKIETLNTNLMNGVTSIVDAINDISITGGGGSSSDYTGILNQILNANMYQIPTSDLPFKDWYYDYEDPWFISAYDRIFASLGIQVDDYDNFPATFFVDGTALDFFIDFDKFVGLFSPDSYSAFDNVPSRVEFKPFPYTFGSNFNPDDFSPIWLGPYSDGGVENE